MAAVWAACWALLAASGISPGTTSATLLVAACASIFAIGETLMQPTLPAIVNDLAPDHLRGRVMALYMLLFAGSTPIGGYLTGVMAQAWGVQTAVGIEAALCLVGVAAGLLYYVSHRHLIDDMPTLPAAGAPARAA